MRDPALLRCWVAMYPPPSVHDGQFLRAQSWEFLGNLYSGLGLSWCGYELLRKTDIMRLPLQ